MLFRSVHGNTEYPYIFPDLKPQYALCDGLIAHPLPKVKPTPWQPEFCGTLSRDAALAAAARTGEFQRVPPAQPLRALKTLHLPPQPNGEVRRPRLVVVAISGGAYRAAFWGALVLDRLRQESEPGRPLEGLAQSIRLLTGASGGMVPAAYFAVQPAQGVEKAMEADIVGANASPGSPEPADGSFDSLTPIARQLVQDDLLNTLLPRRRDHDRGTALEDQWKTLDVTFESLRESEAQGNRPSLIFSPMIAETGQPLLISNLDLAGIPDRDSDQAVDLFKKMPEAPGLLKLKTAVRMSATFPFVSPSVSLPTIPPLHVLDAGYFDNYGMSIALGYLKQPDIVQWLADNTSGVMLIQIKAFAQSAEADTGIAGKCRQPPAVPDSWINRAFSAVTSPLAGLFNSRGSSMVFRNDLELDSLKQLLGKTRDKDGNPLRLDSIAFDNAARASFSWYLPKGDLDCMRQQLNAPRIASQFKKLEAAWNAWAPTITSADIAEPTPPEPQ